MSGALSVLSAGGEDSDPKFTYLQTLSALGSRSANNSYTVTVNIGDPHPNRRLILYNTSDLFPSGTLYFTCTVNGNSTTRISTGGWSEGQAITSAFTIWAGNASLWISDPIPTGTTATLVFNCTVDAWIGPIGVIRVDNLLNNLPITSVEVRSSSSSTITVPIGGIIVFQSEASNFGSQDSASTITNATYRFRSSFAGGSSVSPFSGFDYQNTTRTQQTVTFAQNSGWINYYVFR